MKNKQTNKHTRTSKIMYRYQYVHMYLYLQSTFPTNFGKIRLEKIMLLKFIRSRFEQHIKNIILTKLLN